MILRAAQNEFAVRGYEGATMRGIARSAAVDPKLVHYYFGTKSELFKRAVVHAVIQQGFIERLFSQNTGGNQRGTQFFRFVLEMYESPELGGPAIGLLRNISTHKESRELVLEIFEKYIVENLSPRLAGPDPVERIALVGSQILGVVTMRYILKIPAITELSINEIASVVGPNIDWYLFGEWPTKNDRQENEQNGVDCFGRHGSNGTSLSEALARKLG